MIPSNTPDPMAPAVSAAELAAVEAKADQGIANAATADGKAVAAQADATAGIVAAAAAQADATAAIAAAAAAQADIDEAPDLYVARQPVSQHYVLDLFGSALPQGLAPGGNAPVGGEQGDSGRLCLRCVPLAGGSSNTTWQKPSALGIYRTAYKPKCRGRFLLEEVGAVTGTTYDLGFHLPGGVFRTARLIYWPGLVPGADEEKFHLIAAGPAGWEAQPVDLVAAADVWYEYEIEWEAGEVRMRVREEGGAWTSWASVTTANKTPEVGAGIALYLYANATDGGAANAALNVFKAESWHREGP